MGNALQVLALASTVALAGQVIAQAPFYENSGFAGCAFDTAVSEQVEQERSVIVNRSGEPRAWQQGRGRPRQGMPKRKLKERQFALLAFENSAGTQ